MNFFEHQRVAKKETFVLTLHFIFAVIAIIAISNIVLFIGIEFIYLEGESLPWEQKKIFYTLFTCAQLLVILLGMCFKILQLQGGGKVIANMLGGFPLEKTTKELNQRKIVNIVDEISVASGIPSPPIYLLEGEPSINAFVAGFHTNDAVIAVTEGAIRHLDRDELQTVIAHEYSHLFNGDMKLNTYLVGVLHGIQMISILGSEIMEMTSERDNDYGLGRRRGGGKLWVVGMLLHVVGYLGVLFGRLIKKEINIQREYLADATAVQFTRNSMALASTFKKILANDRHQYLKCGMHDVVGHMCVTEVNINKRGSNPNYTHPELVERIMRVEPNFNEEDFLKNEIEKVRESIELKNKEEEPVHPNILDKVRKELEGEDIDKSLILGSKALMGAILLDPNANVDFHKKIKQSIGNISVESLGYSIRLLDSIPVELREYAQNLDLSRSIIYGLFLNLSGLETFQLKEETEKVRGFIPKAQEKLKTLERSKHLPLIDLCLSSLRELSKKQNSIFIRNLKLIIKSDSKINLQEYLYYSIIKSFLDKKKKIFGGSTIKIGKALNEIEYLVSTLAYAGFPEDREGASLAFRRVNSDIFDNRLNFMELEDFKVSVLNKNFSKLKRLKIEEKELLIGACISLIKFDRRTIPIELESLRAIGAILEVPIPLTFLKEENLK
ncbi:MAG: hypothetical protein CME70_14855 [Halobacteriovorax sp.]|nr:hypothetical protein [Halobacteriovorax sp.]|tara:strand:+ start:160095 stop:162101 length:2007 start_codon:yes stop_codon:yes gene_type:complete